MKITSSLGNQEKYIFDGIWYKFDQYGYEGLAETLTSLFYSCWAEQIPFVSYSETLVDFVSDSKKIVFKRGCTSEDFLKSDYEIMTLATLLDKSGINTNIAFYKKKTTLEKIELILNVLYNQLNLDASTYLAHQLSLDTFILNDDRHLNNIIFIYDKISGLFRPGPLFDHGAGLLSRTDLYPLSSVTRGVLNKLKCLPFSADFGKQIAAIQAVTGFIPTLQESKVMELFNYRSSVYSYEEVTRALSVIEYTLSTTKMKWGYV